MFKFDKKFGWSEIVSLIAIVLSLYVFWKTSRDSSAIISIKDMTPFRITAAANPDIILAGFPLIVTNRGGRPASLLELVSSDEPLALKIKKGASFKNDPTLEVKYAVEKSIPNSSEELAKLILQSSLRYLSSPQLLNVPIGSGESVPITLIISIRANDGASLKDEDVVFSARLSFSDGTSYRLAQYFGHKEIWAQ
jgi:hypothetical protein